MAITAAELRASKAGLIAEARSIAEMENPSATDKATAEELIAKYNAVEARAVALDRIESLEAAQNESAGVVSSGLPHTDAKNTRKGVHKYSLMRAVTQQLAGKLSGLELECSDELAKLSQSTPKGFYMPFDVPHVERRDAAGLNVATGSGALKTTVADTVIGKLRSQTLLDKLGVQTLTDLQGTFKLPKQSSLAQVFWVGAGNDVDTSYAAVQDQVVFTPKTVGSWQDVSRRFLSSSSLDGETWLRNELINALALGIDLSGFSGGMTANEPVGIINLPGRHNISFGPNATTAGAPTWGKILAMEAAVESANALALANEDSYAYVMHPKLKSILKQTPKLSGSQYSDFIWDRDGRVNGYKTFSSTQLPGNLLKGYDPENPTAHPGDGPCAAAIFGHFPSLVVAYYTGIDVIPDHTTGAKAGTIRITVLQDVDIESRHDEAFATVLDAKV